MCPVMSSPPQALRIRAQESGPAQLLADRREAAGARARESPNAGSSIDRVIDVPKRSGAETPAARLERLQIDRHREPAHGSLAVHVEEPFEVSQAQRDIWIDRLARAERRVIRFRHASPEPVAFAQREAVAVVADGIDPHQPRRVAELAERRAGEKGSAVALRLVTAHDRAGGRGAASLVVREFVEELLDVRRSSQARQNSALARCPSVACRHFYAAATRSSGFLRMSRKSRPMPMQIAESATLNAGQWWAWPPKFR